MYRSSSFRKIYIHENLKEQVADAEDLLYVNVRVSESFIFFWMIGGLRIGAKDSERGVCHDHDRYLWDVFFSVVKFGEWRNRIGIGIGIENKGEEKKR